MGEVAIGGERARDVDGKRKKSAAATRPRGHGEGLSERCARQRSGLIHAIGVETNETLQVKSYLQVVSRVEGDRWNLGD